MKQKITIIGGTDGFGKWLAGFILDNFSDNIELTITGRDKEKGEKAANELKCHFTTDTKEVVGDSDITIFAVPIGLTSKLIEMYAPYIKLGSVVCDVTSIKKEPSKALKKYAPKGVLVIPTHPMFGPFVSSIAGQIFVLTPENEVKKDIRYEFLTNFLNKSGAKVVEETAEEHDKMMAVVQGLTHLNVFVLADTMKKLDFNISKSFSFVSPIYKIMISSVGRYVSQNPKLYADIQMNNSEVLKVHKEFMKSISDFNKFVENKDEKLFIKNIENSKKYFKDEAKKGQVYTDKIIFMLSKQIEKAEGLVGKKIILENIYSKNYKSDFLIKLEEEKLYLKSGEILELGEWNII